jgi:uncharacterized sodium:solute symporter family permease YidK
MPSLRSRVSRLAGRSLAEGQRGHVLASTLALVPAYQAAVPCVISGEMPAGQALAMGLRRVNNRVALW